MHRSWGINIIVILIATSALSAGPLGTAFTYQGQLKQDAVPANGSYDFRFRLLTGDETVILDNICVIGVEVINGRFTAEVDFGQDVFDGSSLALQVFVQEHGQAVDCTSNTMPDLFTPLVPTQPITPAPYAINALSAPPGHSLDAPDGSPLNAVVVDVNGNVGVGAATPEARLHVLAGSAGAVTANDDAGLVVEDNNATYISMLTPDVSESGILFGSPVNGANGGIIFNNAALPDGLQFRINGNQTRMVIESTGEVGIGTTAPAASLHVAGDVRTDGATGYNTRNSNNLGANAIFGWSNDVPRIRIGGDGVGAANGLDIQTTSDRSLLRLLHSGDVGISTTTPETELDVRSLNADDPGRVRAANSSADTWVELWSGFSNGSNDPAVIWSDDLAGDDLRFGIGDQDGAPFTELMRITGAGNVGIGTTAPARRLHVSAGSSGATSTSSAEAVIEDDASTFMHFLTPNNTESGILFGDPTHSIGGGIVFNSAANPEGMQFRAGGNNTQMVLDASGNLGIGTTSPAQKLDVSGNIQLTGEVRRVATGTANMVPVAYGRVRENGTIASGSGNFTATWNSGAEHYEITVTGEAIDSSSCTVLVTLLAGSSDGVRTAYTSSVGGRLVVEIHDVFGPILHDFSFVVFKP